MTNVRFIFETFAGISYHDNITLNQEDIDNSLEKLFKLHGIIKSDTKEDYNNIGTLTTSYQYYFFDFIIGKEQITINKSFREIFLNDQRKSINITIVPKKTTHLTLNDNMNQSLDNLHERLTHLTLGEKTNQSLANLPEGLTYLTLG